MAITPFEETLEVTIRDGEDVGYSEPSSRVPLRKLLVVRHVSAAFFSHHAGDGGRVTILAVSLPRGGLLSLIPVSIPAR
jgi:hypothetical protein